MPPLAGRGSATAPGFKVALDPRSENFLTSPRGKEAYAPRARILSLHVLRDRPADHGIDDLARAPRDVHAPAVEGSSARLVRHRAGSRRLQPRRREEVA